MGDDKPHTVTVPHLGEEVEVGKRLYVGNLPYRVRWQELKDFFKERGEVVFADVKADRDGRSAGCGIVEFKTPEEAADAMVQMHDKDFNGRKIFVRQDKEDRDLGGKGGGARIKPLKGNAKGRGGGAGGYGRGGYNSYSDGYSHGKGGYGGGYNEGYGKGGYYNDGYGKGGKGKGYGGAKGYGGGGGYDRNRGNAENRCFVNNLAWETTWQDLKDHFKTVGHVVRADIFTNKAGRSAGNGIVEFANAEDAARAIHELQDSELNGRQIFVREDRDK